MSESVTFYCIICGREFRPAAPDGVICHACGGPPEAAAPPRSMEPAAISAPLPERPAVSPRTFATEADVPDEWQVNDNILDLYEVKDIFRTGGMGLVYRVHHRKWNLDLAVKSPRASLFQTEDQKKDFIGEAEAWMDLGLHPHIVTCYYVRTLRGIPRVFAEFVEGGSLKDWIRDRRLYAGDEREALRRILDVAIQFAWGLGYAHEKGMVHQDVKPANALMTPDGTLKVTDFGLVRAKGRASPAYVAPEQDLRLGRQIDRRTDIWCWGVSVLEMFTGKITWMEGSAAPFALEAYLSAPPADLPRMPQGVADLLRDCFQEDPALRPPDMDAVAERLMAVYEQEFGESYPREKPNPLDLRADSLNNRAVSYLDLGREEEAVRFWQEALQVDPAHLEANFNYGYYRWHRAELLGSEYLKQMQQLESTHGHDPEYWRLLGWIYLEQGYVDEVEEILQKRSVQDEALERAHRDPNRPVVRQVRRMKGHTVGITSVAFSPDGRYAISGHRDGIVRLWEPMTGREIRQFEGHISDVNVVAFSPDGHYILSGGIDKTVRLWDVMTAQELRRFEGHTSSVEAIAISPDGRYIASGARDRVINLWETETGQLLHRFEGHKGIVYTLHFTKSGYLLISGGDKTLRMWDTRNGQEVCRIETTGYIHHIALAPDDLYVLVNDGPAIQVWEMESKRNVRRFVGHTDTVRSFTFSPDGRYILSGSWDKTVRLWDAITGRELRRLDAHSSWVESVAYSPDGCYALSADRDQFMFLWETRYPPSLVSGRPFFPALVKIYPAVQLDTDQKLVLEMLQDAQKQIVENNLRPAYSLLRHAQKVSGYERDDKIQCLLAALGLKGRRVGLRDAWQSRILQRGMGNIQTVAFFPNRLVALSGGDDKVIRLWDIGTGKENLCLKGHTSTVISLAVSPNGCYVLSGSADSTARLWDSENGREQKCFVCDGPALSVAFSPDNHYALIASSENVLLWDLINDRLVRKLQGETSLIRPVAFSPDGKHFLFCRGEVVNIVGTGSGDQTTLVLRGVYNSTFSPNGQYIVGTVGPYRREALCLWDTVNKQKIRFGESVLVKSISFSPDGYYLLSAGGDEMVRFWDIASLRQVMQLVHPAFVDSVAFSPDGRYVLTGCRDQNLRLWELDWDYEFPDPADWDEGARPYLDIFLTLHTPYGPDGLSRVGAPQWTEEDFQKLLRELGIRGYGWLRPEGVCRELEKMARERGWKGG